MNSEFESIVRQLKEGGVSAPEWLLPGGDPKLAVDTLLGSLENRSALLSLVMKGELGNVVEITKQLVLRVGEFSSIDFADRTFREELEELLFKRSRSRIARAEERSWHIRELMRHEDEFFTAMTQELAQRESVASWVEQLASELERRMEENKSDEVELESLATLVKSVKLANEVGTGGVMDALQRLARRRRSVERLFRQVEGYLLEIPGYSPNAQTLQLLASH